MLVIINFVFLIIYIMMFIFNAIFFKKIFSYLNILVSVFGIASFLSTFGLFGFYIPTLNTYILVFLFLLLLEIFSIFNVSIFSKFDFRLLSINEAEFNYKLALMILLVIFMFCLPKSLDGLSIIRRYGFSKLRNMYLNGELYSTLISLLLYFLFIPTNFVIMMYSLISDINKKKISIVSALSLINTIQFVLIFGGRSYLFEAIILLFIISLNFYGSFIKVILNNKKVMYCIALFAVLMVFITSQRSLNDSGFLFNMYSYVCGSFHLFGYLNDNPGLSLLDGNHLTYGYVTFNPFIEPFKILLNTFLHTDIKTGIEIVNEVLQKYYLIAPNTLMNNNVTCLYDFVRDFGSVGGIVIGSMYISLLFGLSECINLKNRSYFGIVFYTYMIYQAMFLIFECTIARGTLLFYLIFIVLYYKILFRRKK